MRTNNEKFDTETRPTTNLRDFRLTTGHVLGFLALGRDGNTRRERRLMAAFFPGRKRVFRQHAVANAVFAFFVEILNRSRGHFLHWLESFLNDTKFLLLFCGMMFDDLSLGSL